MVNWQDKNGKSFIYDERGHVRLLQICGEKEIDNSGEPYIVFGVQANYPAKDLEHERPFGYSSYENGPTVIVEVPKSALGEDKDNANRFALLDKLEDIYKQDLLGEQQGLARLVKQFVTDAKGIDIFSMERRGQTAVYFQKELQGVVNEILKDKIIEKKIIPQQKEKRNCFLELSYNQKHFVISAQNYFRDRDIHNKYGKVPSFDSKAENAQDEFRRFKKESLDLGFKEKHVIFGKSKTFLKPKSKEIDLFDGRNM